MTRNDLDRRQFLKIAAGTAGAATLAGCGTRGRDGDATPTGTESGSDGTTTASTPSTTAAQPATGDPCDRVITAGFVRYDGARKPIQYTLEYPDGWEVISETPFDTGYTALVETEFDVGDEGYDFGMTFLSGREPLDDPNLDSFVESGWIDFQVDFGGAPGRIVLSPLGNALGRQAFGYLPFDGPAGRTLHAVQIVVFPDNNADCDDALDAVIRNAIESIQPNPAGTFAPIEE